MFPPKEIVLNLAMHSATVRSAARRRHNTGILADPVQGQRTLKQFMSKIPLPLEGVRILELGPGQGVQLAQAAIEAGASYAAFDVAQYLDTATADRLGIDYQVDAEGRMPWQPNSFDIVWSHSVLEHVRHPVEVLRQIQEVLVADGYHVGSIDLESHLGGREDPEHMYEFLKYPPWLWGLMTSHRSVYVNGLRLSEWRNAFDDAGMLIVDEQRTDARCGLNALQNVSYLSHLSDDDLLTKHVMFTARAIK